MLPYLLPILLILYGEFSKDINTRFIGRVLFYTYTSSQLIIPQMLSGNSVIFGSMVIFLYGIGYCIVRCRNFFSRSAFVLAGGCYMLNSLAVYLQDFTLLLSIPYYADYSHIIIRESILTGLAAFAVWKENKNERDEELAYVTLGVLVIESLFI